MNDVYIAAPLSFLGQRANGHGTRRDNFVKIR